MTKNEAIEAMQNGFEVTHCYFSTGEYIYMNETGSLIDENGLILDGVEFWEYRQAKVFDEGWKIFNPRAV
jgi:hypothetical protein